MSCALLADQVLSPAAKVFNLDIVGARLHSAYSFVSQVKAQRGVHCSLLCAFNGHILVSIQFRGCFFHDSMHLSVSEDVVMCIEQSLADASVKSRGNCFLLCNTILVGSKYPRKIAL